MSFSADFCPTSENEAASIVRCLFEQKRPAAIHGGQTQSGLGRPVQADVSIKARALTGITLYEPAEMVISARSGTSVREIDQLLESNGQMLPFEPRDHRLFYGASGEATIGGITACNSSGPRRIQSGAARDSLLGVRFINGRGEIIKAGGRVMKNVTGLDLARLSCGAHGSLGLLTEVTFKVLPRLSAHVTLACEGLGDSAAVATLTTAVRSPFEISGAAHLPTGFQGPRSLTLIRLEGFEASVNGRREELRRLLANQATFEPIDERTSIGIWREIRDVSYFPADDAEAIWRISVKPTNGPHLVQCLKSIEKRYFYDWSGGLVWLATPATGDAAANEIRAATKVFGGHATLARAPNAVRNAVSVFEPLAEPLMRITAGIKKSIDPSRILNPAVMYAGI